MRTGDKPVRIFYGREMLSRTDTLSPLFFKKWLFTFLFLGLTLILLPVRPPTQKTPLGLVSLSQVG